MFGAFKVIASLSLSFFSKEVETPTDSLPYSMSPDVFLIMEKGAGIWSHVSYDLRCGPHIQPSRLNPG